MDQGFPGLVRHSPPRGRLEHDGSDRRRLAHTGLLGSCSARRADTVSPLLPLSRQLVHPDSARPWPGHPSPAGPPCAAVDGPRPPAAGRRWKLTAGPPIGPWGRGRARTRLAESSARALTATPSVGEGRVRSRHRGEAPGRPHGRAGTPRATKPRKERDVQGTGRLEGGVRWRSTP